MSERANDELPPGCKRVKVAMADGTERIFRVEDLIPCDDPEPWTPKDGERVRIVGEAVVNDVRANEGDVVFVVSPSYRDGNDLALIPRSWVRPHAEPARADEAEAALKRQQWIEGMKADVDYVPSIGWRLYARGLGGWTTSGHDTHAAAVNAAMATHPLKREGV